MSDQYKNLKLMQNVRMALPEVEALKDRMNTIAPLLVGSDVGGGKYCDLDDPIKMLGAEEGDYSPDMEDFFIALSALLENLLKKLEEDMFTAQELRNLGREVDV